MNIKNRSNKNKKNKAGHQSTHRPPNKMPNAIAHSNSQFLLLFGITFLISIVVLLAYYNSFSSPFIYDDDFVIGANPTITSLWPMGLFQNIPEGVNSGTLHVIFSRPITNWTFALNYALGGMDPFGYHVFNVLMHISSSLLIFGIVRRTLLSKSLGAQWGNSAALLALAIALLWGVHPIQTNAIDYITQRLESLADFFYLSALYCLIKSDESKHSTLWLSISVLAAFLGMGSKETMVTAPAILLLYDRTFLSGSFKEALTKRSWFYFGLLLSIGFLIALLMSGHSTSGSLSINTRGAGPNTLAYASTQLGVVLHYLRLTIWPTPLVLDNHWPVANTLNAILWPGLAVAVMLGLTLWGFIRNHPWAFIGLWFFIILSPSSSFVPIMDEYVNEYRMYLPVLAPITLIVIWLYFFLKMIPEKVISLRRINQIFMLAIIVATVSLSIATHNRNSDYQNEITMWKGNVENTPNNPRAHSNLGHALAQNGQLQEAIFEYQRGIAGYEYDSQIHNNLGLVFERNNQFNEAKTEFRKAIQINPGYGDAHANLGLVLARNNNIDEATIELKKAVELNPNNTEAHKNLGVIYYQHNKTELAISEFKAANSISKNDSIISDYLQISLNRLAIEFYSAGNKILAIEKLKEVLRINPNNADANKNILMMLNSK